MKFYTVFGGCMCLFVWVHVFVCLSVVYHDVVDLSPRESKNMVLFRIWVFFRIWGFSEFHLCFSELRLKLKSSKLLQFLACLSVFHWIFVLIIVILINLRVIVFVPDLCIMSLGGTIHASCWVFIYKCFWVESFIFIKYTPQLVFKFSKTKKLKLFQV